MEIHKPHAAKSWKEFFIELGTIVLGILIALGLEQAVVGWHEHRQYLEARQAIRAELSSDIANLSRRQDAMACTQRRLAEIGALLDKAEAHRPIAAASWVGDAYSFRVYYSAEPDAGKSELFSPQEQRQFGRLYGWLHSMDEEQGLERAAWAHLQPLEGRASLPPEMINSLRTSLAEAHYEDDRLRFLLGWLHAGARQAGLDIKPANDDLLSGLAPKAWPQCLPMTTPRDEALRQSKWFVEKYAP